MHWCGVDRYQQSRFFDQGREGEQVQLAGEIDYRYFQPFADGGKMPPFGGVVATGQHRTQPEFLRRESDRRRPAIRFPKFILACRAWMKNGEWLVVHPISYDGRGVCARYFRQVELQFRRRVGDSEGLEQ